MKNLYKINSWAFIITLLLLFTFWGGIIALPLLGITQIIMSLKIIYHYKQLNKTTQKLFNGYIVLTSTIIICLKFSNLDALLVMFIWAITSMFLAGFHLYITYKISKS
jgi:hypothetical protein